MLPFRSGRSWKKGASAAFFVAAILLSAAMAAGPKRSPSPTASPKNSLAPGGIPLPIGHEAKGLILPDYNPKGQLQARFEAALAKRMDEDHLRFTGLKMSTYTEKGAPELTIDMPVCTLDLNTRVLISHERTTVTRSDFKIAGDVMRFDTVARQGTLKGNVKMVITDNSQLMGKSGE